MHNNYQMKLVSVAHCSRLKYRFYPLYAKSKWGREMPFFGFVTGGLEWLMAALCSLLPRLFIFTTNFLAGQEFCNIFFPARLQLV